MEQRPAGKKLTSFIQDDQGKWSQSPELQKALGILQQNTDKKVKVEMYPSPMMAGPDNPAWGSGNGVYQPNTGRAFVDPLAHPTVAVHEGAHQTMMSQHATDHSFNPKYQARAFGQLMDPGNATDKMINKGATLRMGYETLDKPFMIEEANAQGITQGVMDKAGIPVDTSGWPDMYAYPEAYQFGGPFSKSTPAYQQSFNKPGIATFTEGEAGEIGRIRKSAPIAVRRQFQKGYESIK